jgi:hypothetical protein
MKAEKQTSCIDSSFILHPFEESEPDVNCSKWLPVIEDAALTGAAALLTYLIAHVGDLPLGTLAPILVAALTVVLSAVKAHLAQIGDPPPDDSPPSDGARAIIPFLLALVCFALLAAPAPAQLFGGWRTSVLLDHERRIATLEGKASVPPSAPSPIVIPPAPSPIGTTPAPIQPIIITPPAASPQPAPGPLVLVVPGNGASGPNPQPIPATGPNPQPIPAIGPNPQPIAATGPTPQPLPATGSNPQPIPAVGSNPQPIQPRNATNPQPLPMGLTPPSPPAVPAPAPAANPQAIPASSGYYRAFRYPNGAIVYLWTR